MKSIVLIISIALYIMVVSGAQVDITWNQNDFPKVPVNAQVGDIVNFVNTDGDTHSIKFTSAPTGVELYESDKSSSNITYVFKVEGEYTIQCTIHENMKVTIQVAPAPTTKPPVTEESNLTNPPTDTEKPVAETDAPSNNKQEESHSSHSNTIKSSIILGFASIFTASLLL